MRNGTHIGKIIIADPEYRDVIVPIQPAIKELDLDVSKTYLIIGGLKGLCGSLAIYLARRGARNLMIMSRSGYDDPKSEAVLQNLSALNVRTQLVVGDVSCLKDVEKAFGTASCPVAGVILGAMVLRVS